MDAIVRHALTGPICIQLVPIGLPTDIHRPLRNSREGVRPLPTGHGSTDDQTAINCTSEVDRLPIPSCHFSIASSQLHNEQRRSGHSSTVCQQVLYGETANPIPHSWPAGAGCRRTTVSCPLTGTGRRGHRQLKRLPTHPEPDDVGWLRTPCAWVATPSLGRPAAAGAAEVAARGQGGHEKIRPPLRGTWRGGRVVDGSGLENQRGASLRGFESHPLRFQQHLARPQPPPIVPKKLSLLIMRRRSSAPIMRSHPALIPEFSAAQPIGERLQWIRRSLPLGCRR